MWLLYSSSVQLTFSRLLKILNLLKTHPFKVAFTDKSLLSFKSLQGFCRHIIWGIIILHIICTAPLIGSC